MHKIINNRIFYFSTFNAMTGWLPRNTPSLYRLRRRVKATLATSRNENQQLKTLYYFAAPPYFQCAAKL